MARDPNRPSGFLSRREAAERIGVHPDHLLRLIRQQRIKLTPHARPAWRARRKLWFAEAEVAKAATARKVLYS